MPLLAGSIFIPGARELGEPVVTQEVWERVHFQKDDM